MMGRWEAFCEIYLFSYVKLYDAVVWLMIYLINVLYDQRIICTATEIIVLHGAYAGAFQICH